MHGLENEPIIISSSLIIHSSSYLHIVVFSPPSHRVQTLAPKSIESLYNVGRMWFTFLGVDILCRSGVCICCHSKQQQASASNVRRVARDRVESRMTVMNAMIIFLDFIQFIEYVLHFWGGSSCVDQEFVSVVTASSSKHQPAMFGRGWRVTGWSPG